MTEETIGIKELYTALPRIAKEVQQGKKYIVCKHYTPLLNLKGNPRLNLH
jgi:antitoxin (DNA-binding transcriptional repressor) of toxin-antitoxin stability system